VPVAYTFLDDAKRYLNIALVWLRLRKPDPVAPAAPAIAE